MALTQELIVQTALKLLNEIGLDNLSTRRLGQELGVEGPAFYRHFKSKAELFDHMVAAILLPVLRPPRPGQQWDDWLVSIARVSIAEVMRHRDGAKLVANSLPTEPLDLLSKPLRDAGFADEDALYASKLFIRFMVGWQLHEANELYRTDRAKEVYDHRAAFDFALNIIIDGLRQKLESSRSINPTLGAEGAVPKRRRAGKQL
ncbi:TetR family transcriptional regulator [Niveispirillum sp. BGYR6]|uniref:TetR family transcriptional regulator n=1 Tax=Niveispirillum sp. BGYR6 TaxID=2971249 RepID=UPI0022B94A42|nr:TetR family transcriptional regulator [Niveispirillum sp. BGYR6]MDG5497510.1 TetR family transcriptional regulator [Niveispirillum sp. BGYR6]